MVFYQHLRKLTWKLKIYLEKGETTNFVVPAVSFGVYNLFDKPNHQYNINVYYTLMKPDEVDNH